MFGTHRAVNISFCDHKLSLGVIRLTNAVGEGVTKISKMFLGHYSDSRAEPALIKCRTGVFRKFKLLGQLSFLNSDLARSIS
jgi:hypothetical protein